MKLSAKKELKYFHISYINVPKDIKAIEIRKGCTYYPNKTKPNQ